MNSASNIRADGEARVRIGDVRNSPVSVSRAIYYWDARSRKEILEATRIDFLKRLRTSPYEDRKDRNPKRADGTCQWFINHRLFRNWREETSGPLWVSADPGCGKSVLAKYLVDDVFPPSATRTTCYFFFKNDFDDQKTLEGALCCILHQLFRQNPALLSDDVLEDFKAEGDHLTSFNKLWKILIGAAGHHTHGELICLIDALDECVAPTRLVEALAEFYTKEHRAPLKFLVTSRPYLQIRRAFQTLKEAQPTIHLSGEGQEEADQIAEEIAISIKQRTEVLCKKLELTLHQKQIMDEELAAFKHRTHLLVYLVFAVLEDAVLLSQEDLWMAIRNIPLTVEEAYNKILGKSSNPDQARKILHAIVAADRPLRLTEMAVVLAFRGESHRCHKDLEQELQSPECLTTAIRDTCGLFVVIDDSQVFLFHQTAREFLVQLQPVAQLLPVLSDMRSPSLEWQYSFDPKDSHALLSKICIRYLLLTDFQDWKCDAKGFVFFDYAASHWADHYRRAGNASSEDLEPSALRLCQTDSPVFASWSIVYERGQNQWARLHVWKELTTSFLIASYFGLDNIVNLILQKNKVDLSASGAETQRTALSWASEKGYESIVKSVLGRLQKYKVILKSWSPFRTMVNQEDWRGRTPLWYAAANGHGSIVQLLLKKGAKARLRDDFGQTPLSLAIYHGNSHIVELLLENGARNDSGASHLETRDRFGRTPLLNAVHDRNETAVQMLLDQGAQGSTETLNLASENGHQAIVQLLLDRGAQTGASMHASRSGQQGIIQLLQNLGANVNASNKEGETALHKAAGRGHYAVIQLLLDRGAQIDASTELGDTALHSAVNGGHYTIAQLLLDRGAQVNASDKEGGTVLHKAASIDRYVIAQLLLDRGANVNAADEKGETALYKAARLNCYDVARLLLDRGAEIDASNKEGETALYKAASYYHFTIVQLLLDRGAKVSTKVLELTSYGRDDAIVELLQRHLVPGRKGEKVARHCRQACESNHRRGGGV